MLESWIGELPNDANGPLFPSNRGGPLSRDAVDRIVARHCRAACQNCASLRGKKITPHSLRHSAAMALLKQGARCIEIALWLGHESVETTQVYLHADPGIKEKAMEKTRPAKVHPGRFKPEDLLLAYLKSR